MLTSAIVATTFPARMAFWFGGARDDDNPWVGLTMLILSPIAAMLIQMAISRTREHAGDETSARVTHNADELISTLGKLESWSTDPAAAHRIAPSRPCGAADWRARGIGTCRPCA